MTGWLVLAAVAGLGVGAFWLLGLRQGMFYLAVTAVLLGSAGYAVQGRPDLRGSPQSVRSQEPPVALTTLRHAFYGNFSATEHWLLVSEALARRGNTADAAGALKAAVREHPRDPQLWVGLGNALVDHARGLTPASEFAYRRAAELSPGYPGPSFFLGLAYLRSGEREAAASIWRDLLANAPTEASWRPLVEEALAVADSAGAPRL